MRLFVREQASSPTPGASSAGRVVLAVAFHPRPPRHLGEHAAASDEAARLIQSRVRGRQVRSSQQRAQEARLLLTHTETAVIKVTALRAQKLKVVQTFGWQDPFVIVTALPWGDSAQCEPTRSY